MNTLETIHGMLKGVGGVLKDAQGRLTMASVNEACELQTSVGLLTPQYTTDDLRRPRVESLLFHPNGHVKSLPLEVSTPVDTPLGKLNAELVTFYEDGSVRRVFPVNGKLSGHWDWNNEGTLNNPVTLQTPAGSFTAKLISVQFFADGALRSVTLWPGEQVTIQSPAGAVKTRVGMAFYQDGTLRSLEPAEPVMVSTPIGGIEAFDSDPEGITGDENSLTFTPSGEVQSLATVTFGLTVSGPEGVREFKPAWGVNLCDESERTVLPLVVSFGNGRVTCAGESSGVFSPADCTVEVKRLFPRATAIAYACGEGDMSQAQAMTILPSMPGK